MKSNPKSLATCGNMVLDCDRRLICVTVSGTSGRIATNCKLVSRMCIYTGMHSIKGNKSRKYLGEYDYVKSIYLMCTGSQMLSEHNI